jgi:hypothetical protein
MAPCIMPYDAAAASSCHDICAMRDMRYTIYHIIDHRYVMNQVPRPFTGDQEQEPRGGVKRKEKKEGEAGGDVHCLSQPQRSQKSHDI